MKDTVLVFGSGRSGTSWLCETMARPKGYRLLFEPEHEDHVPEGRVLTDQLLIPGENYKNVDRFLTKLYKNRIDNDWIAQHSFRKFKIHLWPFLVNKKIIKFVRCNLSMHYMASKYKVHAVYIQRNPYNTLFSQNRVKFPWLYDLSRFRQQNNLHKAIFDMFGIDISNDRFSPLQNLSIRWAIENIFPFRYFDSYNSNLTCVNYEALINNSENYKSLISKVDLDAPVDLIEQLNRPSSKTHPKSNILDKKPDKAQQHFNKSELEEINSILKIFGYVDTMH